MKTLIINGSPRVNGDNAALIRELRRNLRGDDFDGVVLASPVYFADLPGPVRSLLSRFQWQRGAPPGSYSSS